MEFTDWLDLLYQGDGQELVDGFCKERGITQELTEETRNKLLREFHRTYQAFMAKSVEYNTDYAQLDIDESPHTDILSVHASHTNEAATL
jgi:hypothetical protein